MTALPFHSDQSAPTPEGRAAGDIETQTRLIGHALFRQIAQQRGSLSPVSRLHQWAMGLSMRDERLKAQMFRFVDVLPVLRTPAQIGQHLREYLGPAHVTLPRPLRLLLRNLPAGRPWAGGLAALTHLGAHQMARQFIAADNPQAAAEEALAMRRQRLAFTIDVLGEAVVSEEEAERYTQQYLDLIDQLSDRLTERQVPRDPLLDESPFGPVPRVNLSIKLSSLFSQFEPIDPASTAAAVLPRLRRILTRARQRGAFIHFDMEQSAYAGVTLTIFKQILTEPAFRQWPNAGIVIQAYLKRSEGDLEELAQWARQRGTAVWVRLVKGAYWDYETIIARQNGWPSPVFSRKPETDANYETLSDRLIRRWEHLRPAIASHNVRSVAHAMAVAASLRLPAKTVEFQMLYGMADELKAAVRDSGHRVRVYMPVGELMPGMAYLVRRLLENTSNESFLRAGFVDHVPEEQLLMNPLDLLKPRVKETKIVAGAGAPTTPAPAPMAFQNEPISDFSEPAVQDRMRQALADVSQRLDREYPLLIGDAEIRTDQWIESINPSRLSQRVGLCGRATAEQAKQAIAAAKAAFPGWRDTPPTDRARILRGVGQILRERRFELAAIEVLECGKSWREADGDLAEAIDYCDFYAAQAERLFCPDHRDLPGETNEFIYEPRGVAVIIAPWNFPLAILCGMSAAAFVTGNTVILKPAEQSPVMGAMLGEVYQQAGAPPGVVNYLSGFGEEVGPTLVSDPDVSLIAFTGSRAVGLKINESASHTPPGQDHVKRLIVEMGGKNAIIVDEDADLDEAVHGVIASAFGYAGQKCSACSRVIVLSSIHGAFAERLVEAAKSLRVMPADEPACMVGPVIDAEAKQHIEEAIERGKREAKLLMGGDVGGLAGQGHFVMPHLFGDVTPGSFLDQEEIFGPVLALLRADDLEQAMRIANGTRYALTGGIYSRSPNNIDRARREFRVGNLYINRKITGAMVGRQPFGGFKLSGVGFKAGGSDYLLQFVVPRTITENTLRRGFAPTEEA